MIEDIIREAAYLDTEIKSKTERLRALKAEIATHASFEDGKKTGHLIGAGFSVKVQLKDNVTWDQTKLNTARNIIGDNDFFRAFSWEFKPASKKALDGFLDYHPKAPLVLDAMSSKPGSPQVTFELLEDRDAA